MDRYWHNSFNGLTTHGLPILNNYTQQLQTEPTQQLYQHQHTIQSLQQQQQQQHHHLLQQDTSPVGHHQQQQQPQTQQQFYTQPQHIASSSTTSQTMQLHLPPNQAIYVSTDNFGNAANATKMTAYMPPIINSGTELQQQLPIASTAATPTTISSNGSPVVLDRINICINNHYTDSGAVTTGTSPMAMSADTPPLPSPIIPNIQYSGAIDPSYLMDSTTNNNDVNSNAFIPTLVPPVISEPDSTTTSNTPPTTPETANTVHLVTTIQSPSTSSSASELEPIGKANPGKLDEKEINDNENENEILDKNSLYPIESFTSESNEVETLEVSSVNQMEPLTPVAAEILFAVGEDVFVRKEDDRLYLGTIIDSKYQKYRIRFDDKSELWCSAKEMRKFGNFGDKTASPGEKTHDDTEAGVLCVACKVRDQKGVEICERCGRGYHHNCTTEISSGSGDWLCKRCNKPMKLNPDEIENICSEANNQQQFPYDIYSLTWDAKHRVNQEQIYCYCGKSGQFDHNMLQCCKCLNWFHTACLEDFEEPMLRGDSNFIFCCSICSTDGKEFLRRLQINTVDFVHLVLYNLSAQRKHQQHKYHHLTKDIFPFVLAQRQTAILPEEWIKLSEESLKDRIAVTLKANPDRFICGREVKRDCYYYGLRNNGPPITPKIDVQQEDILDDVFIVKRLKLKLSGQAMKPVKNNNHKDCNEDPKRTLTTSKDIYEFHSDKEEIDIDIDDEDDEKFTSDDEIPIKHILEKEKRNLKRETKESTNASKFKSPTARKEKDCQKESVEKRSHKRKAFTLSKPYKETAAAAASKRYRSVRNFDSSSDENSSSSRGTSLDLIIPPPKDFLGQNNPFRNVTPKKNSEKKSISFGRSNSVGGTAIKNSVVNTSSLDFSSKLAALKSAGIFPNLNATSLAKAAGQPRMVRTIKRRLSAKDIMIGPNQEVRRRRTRRLSANVEVISTTTINPLPSNIFPINAKDLFISSGAATNRKQSSLSNVASSSPPQSSSNSSASTTLSLSFREQFATSSKQVPEQATSLAKPPNHGRRLRARIQKPVNNNSRRSSLSGVSTSSTSSSSCPVLQAASASASASATTATVSYPESPTFNDLQQSVNKYFGAGNRIRDGEKFSIYAKRYLPNGQVQYLIEWGNENGTNGNAEPLANAEAESPQEKLEISTIE